MFAYLYALLLRLWYFLTSPFQSHSCVTCDCGEYSDEALFMWMTERSRQSTYPDEILAANILGRPLSCSRCKHPRELHGTLSKRVLTVDRIPDGGRVLVEQTTRDNVARRERRFDGVELRQRRPEVEVKVHREGVGDAAKAGDVVVCHYDVFVKDTMEKFESSRGGREFRYTVGQGSMVPGWEIGMKGVKKGERRRFVVPPTLAYGGREIAGRRQVTIVFDVEVFYVDVY